jgi:CDP-glucose 4,6-dehydratase
MTDFEQCFRNRRVLVTGHSGFTGGWLTLWLDAIGANVFGLALAPATSPNLFTVANIKSHCQHRIADIRDFRAVNAVMAEAAPEIVFHLAAQPLVSQSFLDPVESISINTLGTAHVLESARLQPSVKAFVCVTTDKVYDDKGWNWGYRENDALGGRDPYSASKAAAELIAAAYRSTLVQRSNNMAIGVARGGNIIGGGDWANDRIVPDFVRSLFTGAPLMLRHPEAVRPWQHVLALVHGYLLLGSKLIADRSTHSRSYNFGPRDVDVRTVRDLIEGLAARWASPSLQYGDAKFKETHFLRVDSSLARGELGWNPPLDFDETVALTVQWYRDFQAAPNRALEITQGQISTYRARLDLG